MNFFCVLIIVFSPIFANEKGLIGLAASSKNPLKNKIFTNDSYAHVSPKSLNDLLEKNPITRPGSKIPSMIDLCNKCLKDLNGVACVKAGPINLAPILKTLYASYNSITEIPVEISELQELNRLKIDHNKIKVVPDEISQLLSLLYLNLSCNELTVITPLVLLKNLRHLNLANNRIKIIPEELGQCSSLELIDFSGNLIDAVPTTIKSLSALRVLSLDSNKIKQLPDEIGSCSNLQKLDLNNNFLENIPESIVCLTRIAELKILDNSQSLIVSIHKNRAIKKFIMKLETKGTVSYGNPLDPLPQDIKNGIYRLINLD